MGMVPIVCHILIRYSCYIIFPDMAGLQPPVLQRVFSFQVHSGEFVQIVHVRNNHWCVVSTVRCETGAVHVYDSLYKPRKQSA